MYQDKFALRAMGDLSFFLGIEMLRIFMIEFDQVSQNLSQHLLHQEKLLVNLMVYIEV